jgi:hypothetical protein
MKFYRYELVAFANEYDLKLVVREFILLKETPKGYHICMGSLHGYKSNKRWIPKVSKKRYAYPTQLEALDNYILRTRVRRGILLFNADRCDRGIKIAKELYENLKNI